MLTINQSGRSWRPSASSRRTRALGSAMRLLIAALAIGLIAAVHGAAMPPGVAAPASTLDLPRIPWDGGPEYYRKFPNAVDWTDPNFFPIGIWFGNVSSDEEVAFDKAKGINTYVEMWEGTDFNIFPRNDVYWLGHGLVNQDDKSRYNPGVFLDDEVDGWMAPEPGLKHLADLRAALGGDRFTWANFTQMVIGSDLELSYQERYVNDTADAVSVDMYWYSIPFCDWEPYRGDLYAVPVPEATCRTAHSYGLTQEALRLRDAVDGELHPTWTWVENFNGLSGQDPRPYITGGQLKGAAMSTLIHEARALMWFNQSFTGECQTANVIRRAQHEPTTTCGRQYAANIEAMSQVNQLVQSLAPVLNTQSYRWSFGNGLDTMLKVHDGHAYIFAMTDGTTGSRTFTLPAGITGTRVEVLGEGRTVSVEGGRFTDGFANEYDYHVYKISLGSVTATPTPTPSATPTPTPSATPSPAPGIGNVARTARSVAASTENAASGQTAIKAVDGVAEGYPDNPTREWATDGQTTNAWIEMRWDQPVTLDRVVLNDRPNLDDRVTGGILRFSDGTTVAVPSLANDGTATTVTFPARSTTSLRFTTTSTSSTTLNIGLAEFEAWEAGTSPAPTPTPTAMPLATPSAGPSVTPSPTAPSPTATTPSGDVRADLVRSKSVRLVFGHQSVGAGILDAIPAAFSAYGLDAPRVEYYRSSAAAGTGPMIVENGIGNNGDPMSKMAAFVDLMGSDAARSANVAMMKFCYIDFDRSTDVQSVFDQYVRTMSELEAAYPEVKFLYATAPVTTEGEWAPVEGSAVTGVTGRDDGSNNMARERFNTLVRQKYGSTGRLFDVAAVESRTAEGLYATKSFDGQAYFVMNPDLASSDGQHPSASGSAVLATEMMRLVGSTQR